jgi:hypothetical protein
LWSILIWSISVSDNPRYWAISSKSFPITLINFDTSSSVKTGTVSSMSMVTSVIIQNVLSIVHRKVHTYLRCYWIIICQSPVCVLCLSINCQFNFP